MIGIASYDSDEETAPALVAKATASEAKPKPAGAGPKAATRPPSAGPKIGGGGGASASKPQAEARARQLQKEIGDQKSATAVVQVVRRAIDNQWDIRWGADALHTIAKRSTARTRKEWATDAMVKKLAKRLKDACSSTDNFSPLGSEGVDVLLIALDGLRRMAFQEAEAQREALEKAVLLLVADGWKRPVRSISRLFWLAAPLKLKGGGKVNDFSSLLPNALKQRAQELLGSDLALLISAMRQEGVFDAGLLSKVVGRLKIEGVFAGLSATDLIEIAEGLREHCVEEEEALRPLGQEILRRRGELTPDESHRVHAAFQAMKLPLPEVWMQPGSAMKRDRAQIVTTQAFRPQEGHEKKRRGNNDLERTSPPRVVRDYKMMSY